MRQIFTLIILLTSIITHVAVAQTAVERQTGRVVDAFGNPVAGATVTILPSGLITSTSEDGKFSFRSNLQMDSLAVTVIGYETARMSVADFNTRGSSIVLISAPASLVSVTVAAPPGRHLDPVSQSDIIIRGINNSQQVLQFVPGLFIGQHAGGGKAEQIFLRGFDIDHGTDINISVDGMPVNMVSHAHGQGYADMHFLIPELIENVRFNKGPYYPDKGNLATAGYVDFRTKNVLPHNMLTAEAGLFNTYRGVGMVNVLNQKTRLKGHSAYIASEFMHSDGYFENPQDFRRQNVFAKYYGRLGSKNTLSVTASTFSSRWNASGQIPERAVNSGLISYFGAIDPNEGGSTSRSNLNAGLYTTLANGNTIRNHVWFTDYTFELFSNFTFFNVDSVNGDQIRQKEKRSMLGYNASYSFVNYPGDKKLITEIGVFARYDITRDSELSRTRNRKETLERIKFGNIRELNAAVYIDETVRLNDQLSLKAGLRLDRLDMQYTDKLLNNERSRVAANIVSPKFTMYYNPTAATGFYLALGKGFHSNDTRVAVHTGGRNISPAAWGADLGVVFKPMPGLLINSAVWYLYMQQEFIYVGDEGIVEPGGRTSRMGIDLSLRYEPGNRWYIDLDANYSYGRLMDQPKKENFIPLAPVLTSAGGLTFEISKKLKTSIRYRYMGDRPADETNSIVAKGYLVNDLSLNYSARRFSAGLTVDNVFNVKWKETQFDTESRLRGEPSPVSEIHFTPGSPFFFRGSVRCLF